MNARLALALALAAAPAAAPAGLARPLPPEERPPPDLPARHFPDDELPTRDHPARIVDDAAAPETRPEPHAGSEPEALALLERAREALADLASLEASVRVVTDAKGIPADLLPSGSGALRLLKTERGWGARATGSTAARASLDPKQIDLSILPLPDSERWLIAWNDGQEVRTRGADTPIRTLESIGPASDHRLLLPTALAGPAPLYADRETFVFRMGEDAEIAGVRCRVLLVSDPDNDGRQIQLALGADDALPRGFVERVDAGGFGVGYGVELSDLRPDAPLAEVDLLLPGQELRDPNPPARPAQTQAPRTEPRPPATPQPPRRPDGAAPPDFALTLEDGATLTPQDLRGRPTVLYFFGSWSLGSRPVSPLIADLDANPPIEDLAVVAAAVRERPGNNVRAALGSESLPLAPAADDAAQAFQIRVFPTIIVIDQRGLVVDRLQPAPGETPEALLQRLRDALARLTPPNPAAQA